LDKDMLAERLWRHRGRLLRLAMSILANAQDAEDAVSEAAVRAFRHRGELRDEEKALQWLLSIVARASYDLIRKNGRERRAAGEMPRAMPVPVPATDSIYPLLFRLPAGDRQVLTLYYYEDMPAREIAAVLNVSAASVNMRLMRARRRLKAILEQEGVFSGAPKRI